MQQGVTGSKALHLFGAGIAHSRSPVLFGRAFETLGLPWEYTCVECDDGADFLEKALAGDYLAANVTMPFKAAALNVAGSADAAATQAGGANLLVRDKRGLHAYNTDGRGAVLYLQRAGVNLVGAHAVVCGYGVTGRSIAAALSALCADAVILSRSDCAHAARYGTTQADAALRRADIVVDATPLGMCSGDGVAFDPGLLHAQTVILDVVYGHGQTALQCAAQRQGCAYLDGSGMLVGQAAVALPIILKAAYGVCSLSAEDIFAIMGGNETQGCG